MVTKHQIKQRASDNYISLSNRAVAIIQGMIMSDDLKFDDINNIREIRGDDLIDEYCWLYPEERYYEDIGYKTTYRDYKQYMLLNILPYHLSLKQIGEDDYLLMTKPT